MSKLTLPLYMNITVEGRQVFVYARTIEEYQRAIQLDENYLGDESEVDEYLKESGS